MSDLEFSDSEGEQGETHFDMLFQQAADHVQQIHAQLPPMELLELYAYYKQATTGPCHVSKPNVFQMQSRAKWNAWHALGELSKDAAKRAYVQKVQQLDTAWAGQVETTPPRVGWVVHSTLQQAEGEEIHEKTAFDWVREGDLESLRACLEEQGNFSGKLLKELDEHGMGLLHWAADRNKAELLDYLLQSGAEVNLRDAEQQTALHYAASCGHLECVRVLLGHKADCLAADADGQTALDVAEDAEVQALIKKTINL